MDPLTKENSNYSDVERTLKEMKETIKVIKIKLDALEKKIYNDDA